MRDVDGFSSDRRLVGLPPFGCQLEATKLHWNSALVPRSSIPSFQRVHVSPCPCRQVAAVGTPSFGATSATENSFGDFQPDKPSPGSLRHTLFPERYPQIPLSVAEATFGGRATRGENKTKRPTASGLGAHGQQGNPQRAHQTILAVLSAAIREVSCLGVARREEIFIIILREWGPGEHLSIT